MGAVPNINGKLSSLTLTEQKRKIQLKSLKILDLRYCVFFSIFKLICYQVLGLNVVRCTLSV